jgi:hypothetical protein
MVREMSVETVVNGYKTLAVNELVVTPPEKNKGKYVSYLSIKRRPLYVQTPILVVDKFDGSKLLLKVKPSSVFAQTLANVDTNIVDILFKSSAKFFAGKRFSRECLMSRYEPLLTVANRLELVSSANLLIKDQRGADRNISDIRPGMKVIAIVHFPKLWFTKASIKPEASVVQLKIYVEDSLPWLVDNNDSDGDNEPCLDSDDEKTIDDDEVVEEVSALQEDIKGTDEDNEDSEVGNDDDKELVP